MKRIFVTGASGFIGSATVQELLKAGHKVTGLARSEASAKALIAAGCDVIRGDLNDLDALSKGAANSDGVIHLGFIHDFSNYAASCETDKLAIEALGSALIGTARPLVVASGLALISPGRLATEDMHEHGGKFPRASEATSLALAKRGINTIVVRLAPTVHGAGDHGFVPMLINIARDKGVSVQVGEGLNRWNAIHRCDAAILLRLAIEKPLAPGTILHAVGEEGVAFRDIANVIGKHLKVPIKSLTSEEAQQHFGFLGLFSGLDCPASSKLTQDLLGWQPTHSKLLEDLENAGYFEMPKV